MSTTNAGPFTKSLRRSSGGWLGSSAASPQSPRRPMLSTLCDVGLVWSGSLSSRVSLRGDARVLVQQVAILWGLAALDPSHPPASAPLGMRNSHVGVQASACVGLFDLQP